MATWTIVSANEVPCWICHAVLAKRRRPQKSTIARKPVIKECLRHSGRVAAQRIEKNKAPISPTPAITRPHAKCPSDCQPLSKQANPINKLPRVKMPNPAMVALKDQGITDLCSLQRLVGPFHLCSGEKRVESDRAVPTGVCLLSISRPSEEKSWDHQATLL